MNTLISSHKTSRISLNGIFFSIFPFSVHLFHHFDHFLISFFYLIFIHLISFYFSFFEIVAWMRFFFVNSFHNSDAMLILTPSKVRAKIKRIKKFLICIFFPIRFLEFRHWKSICKKCFTINTILRLFESFFFNTSFEKKNGKNPEPKQKEISVASFPFFYHSILVFFFVYYLYRSGAQ